MALAMMASRPAGTDGIRSRQRGTGPWIRAKAMAASVSALNGGSPTTDSNNTTPSE